jgi:hypothetical protein
MDKVLTDKELGSEGNLKLEVVEGKVKLTLKYDSKGLDADVVLLLESEYFVDKLAAAIPGQIDDLLLDLLKKALK